MNRKNETDGVWEAIGCYGLILACTLGPIIMWAVGVITYEWMTQFEFGSGNAYTVGQAFGLTFSFLGLLFLYLVIGAGLGIFTVARVVRFGRWCSQYTKIPILTVTLLNGLMNLVGGSFLVTVVFGYDIPSTPMRNTAMALITSSLLIFNLFLPRWVREITGHR
ncbi:MAG: hypothetical protein AAFR26_01245 [Cyanobacteria bacterium J06626_4]